MRGAKAMVNAGVVDDVDYMFGLHIGFNETMQIALLVVIMASWLLLN